MRRVFYGILWFVLSLFVLSILLSGAPFILDALLRLLFGWLSFLPARLPRATVNWSGVGMLLLCLGLCAAFAHNFCSWLWRGSGRTESWRPRWTAIGLGVVLLMFVSGMAVTGVAHQVGWLMTSEEALTQGRGNERNASTSLKTITSAQADFRANDRDWNHVNDYWRGDIAGLYALKSLADPDGPPIKLIELSVAAADDHPKTGIEAYAVRSPKAGYWYRALLHADEKEPDPQRFAACSYPTSRSAGKWMYIVCEDNTIYRKPFQGEVPAVYPKDPVADGWSKLD